MILHIYTHVYTHNTYIHTLICTNIHVENLTGHPLTKAAILHGGVNGVYEAMYHAVPVLIIPSAFDAMDNAVRMRDKGMAIIIRPCDVTTERVRDAMTDLLTNKRYIVIVAL